MRMDALKNSWRRALGLLLPARCLLCGDDGEAGRDLCAACRGELPANRACCARCALPLAASVALCGSCLRRMPPWDAAWAPFAYGWPLDRLESRFKFAGDLAAGRVLCDLWSLAPRPVDMPQLLLPVPLHRARLRSRGYNQALELGRGLSRQLGIPLHATALRRVRGTEAQTELDAVSRRRNVRDAFTLDSRIALPAHVAVVDDVMTTGATLAECARVLKRAGVARVDVWALARARAPGT
jgi:ComF family protein